MERQEDPFGRDWRDEGDPFAMPRRRVSPFTAALIGLALWAVTSACLLLVAQVLGDAAFLVTAVVAVTTLIAMRAIADKLLGDQELLEPRAALREIAPRAVARAEAVERRLRDRY